MDTDQIINATKNRMTYIFPGENNKRVKVYRNSDDEVVVAVDVHGMTVDKTQGTLNNVIAMMRGAFQLRVVHGYSHGTAIKEMLYTTFKNARATAFVGMKTNYGESYCEVKQLA